MADRPTSSSMRNHGTVLRTPWRIAVLMAVFIGLNALLVLAGNAALTAAGAGRTDEIRAGTTEPVVECRRDISTLWLSWECTADKVTWTSTTEEARYLPTDQPVTFTTPTERTGQRVDVTAERRYDTIRFQGLRQTVLKEDVYSTDHPRPTGLFSSISRALAVAGAIVSSLVITLLVGHLWSRTLPGTSRRSRLFRRR